MSSHWLRNTMAQGHLTNLTLNILFTKTTTICETMKGKLPQKIVMIYVIQFSGMGLENN